MNFIFFIVFLFFIRNSYLYYSPYHFKYPLMERVSDSSGAAAPDCSAAAEAWTEHAHPFNKGTLIDIGVFAPGIPTTITV